MPERVQNRSLPDIRVIDLKNEDVKDSKLPFWLSKPLFEALSETLTNQKQAALFLNRRGTAPIVLCESCGFIHECPNCDISLTLHGTHHLVCHYCDYHEPLRDICPSCREGQLKPQGLGTEQIEVDLKKLFPSARVARADRDEIQNRQQMQEFVEMVEKQEVDLLVGTQMISKGLDFEHLITVGLVLADIGFHLPDFRSTERAFQLITQMAGRAGRHIAPGEKPGQVIVQTFNPEHRALHWALQSNFRGFAEEELSQREELLYPPFGRMINLRISSLKVEKARELGAILASRAEQLQRQDRFRGKVEVLGPSESPLARIRNQYRFQALLKCSDPSLLHRFVKMLLADESWVPPGTRLIVDVDPLQLL